MKTITWAFMLIMATGIGAASADDWPQWLGPDRDGVSMETCREPLARTQHHLVCLGSRVARSASGQ